MTVFDFDIWYKSLKRDHPDIDEIISYISSAMREDSLEILGKSYPELAQLYSLMKQKEDV